MNKEKTAPQEQGAVAAYKKIFLNKMQLHAYSAATIASVEQLSRAINRAPTPTRKESEHARLFQSCFANDANLQIRIEFAG